MIPCLFRDKAKDLGKFVKKFIKEAGKAFKKNKLKSTNYYLVGYGGAIEQPHTYTLKGGKISSGKKVSSYHISVEKNNCTVFCIILLSKLSK